MSSLDDARSRWLAEEPQFAEFGRLIENRIRLSLKAAGFYGVVTSRAKTLESLLKKLVVKPEHSYDSLPDKAGVRVVVRFRPEVDAVADVIAPLFNSSTDVKSHPFNQVGYLGTHIDARLHPSDPEVATYDPSHFRVEIQVRTQSQDLWSVMSHHCAYKPLASPTH